MEKYWIRKYNLPSNHELFQSRTQFDLLVEFWEDYYDQNPLEIHRNEDGHVQFKNTGDSMIDQWEEQLARGETPDFMDSFTAEQIGKLNKLRERGRTRHGHYAKPLKDVVDSIEESAKHEGLGITPFPSTFRNK